MQFIYLHFSKGLVPWKVLGKTASKQRSFHHPYRSLRSPAAVKLLQNFLPICTLFVAMYSCCSHRTNKVLIHYLVVVVD